MFETPTFCFILEVQKEVENTCISHKHSETPTFHNKKKGSEDRQFSVRGLQRLDRGVVLHVQKCEKDYYLCGKFLARYQSP